MELVWPDEVVEEGNLAKNVLPCAKRWDELPMEVSTSKPFRGEGYRFLSGGQKA